MENLYQNGGYNQQQYYNGQQQQGGNNQYYQNYNNNGGQQELFVGPQCASDGGGKIHYGVFYDDECKYPATQVTVQDALGGYQLDDSTLEVSTCIPCSSNAVSLSVFLLSQLSWLDRLLYRRKRSRI